MIETLKLIVLICQVNSGGKLDSINQYQIKCQQYYAKCIEGYSDHDYALRYCMEKRKL